MAERTDDDTSNGEADRKLVSGLRVNLPDSFRGDLSRLRRLHHLVVDSTADAILVKELEDQAERYLEVLSSSMAFYYVIDLLAKALYPPKKSKKSIARHLNY